MLTNKQKEGSGPHLSSGGIWEAFLILSPEFRQPELPVLGGGVGGSQTEMARERFCLQIPEVLPCRLPANQAPKPGTHLHPDLCHPLLLHHWLQRLVEENI